MKITKKLVMIIILFVFLLVIYIYINKSLDEGFTATTWSDKTKQDYINSTKKKDGQNYSAQGIEQTIQGYQKIGIPDTDAESWAQNGTWPWDSAFTNAFKTDIINAPHDGQPAKTADEINTTVTWWNTNIPQKLAQLMTTAYGAPGVSIFDKNGYRCIWNSDNTVALLTNKQTNMIVADADVEKLIPGFKFINGPCNPCNAVMGNYNCPYSAPLPEDQKNVPNPSMGAQYSWKLGPYANSISSFSTSSS